MFALQVTIGYNSVMANRTKLTLKKQKQFCESLVDTGGNVTRACQMVGMSRTAIYEARNTKPDFAEAWDDAVEQGTELLEQEAFRRAFKGVRKPVYQGGERVGYVQEYSDVLTIFLLKARRPEMYRDRASIEHTGANGGPVQHTVDLSALSDSELQQLEKISNKLHPAEKC